MYRRIATSLLYIPLIVKASPSNEMHSSDGGESGGTTVSELDSFDIFGGLLDVSIGDDIDDAAIPMEEVDRESLEWLLHSTIYDEFSFRNVLRAPVVTPEAKEGFRFFDRPVIRMAGIPVDEPMQSNAASSSSSRPKKSKPALRVDTSQPFTKGGPSSIGSSLSDVSLTSTRSEEKSSRSSRKRKSPRTDGVVNVMIDHPELDLDGILTIFGEEADSYRSIATKLMNLRLMPVMFMDIIDTMIKRNPSTKAGDIAKQIKRTVGIAPAFWISLWTDSCFTPGNECLGLEKKMITLDENSQIECYYMDVARWSEVLRNNGYSLESRGGVDLEVYLTALGASSGQSSPDDLEEDRLKLRRITKTKPRVMRVVTPEIPDSDIQEIIAVQMQLDLGISSERIVEIISRAGGYVDLTRVEMIKTNIEKKFVTPVWLHNLMVNNKDLSVEELFTSLVRHLSGMTGGQSLMRQISIDQVRIWKQFCIEGDMESMSTRCHETVDASNGQLVVELTNEQKVRLLSTI